MKVKASCKNAYIVKESKVFVRTSAAAVEAVDPVLKKGSVKRIQGVVERENPLHDFQHEFSAPVTGITPSTQVGRLSGSHSDIGFLLTQFPGGRKAKERKGDRSKHLKVF